MGKAVELREAIRLIWETVEVSKENGNSELPYIFVVGAGISAPEIPSARGIIQQCKDKVNELYKDEPEELKRIYEQANMENENSSKYYSYWFEQAYKNKIHRQKYLKKIIKGARISTSNLLLAQVLNNKEIATTVITPNFDNQLLKSLNLLGNYDVFSADNELDNIALDKNSEDIQIMHVHGTYQFYDCCNLESEIARRANGEGIKSTSRTLEDFFKTQAPIVIGYSGWEDDVIMKSLKERIEYSLPFSMIWFCYSNMDFDNIPLWLKECEDVLFVVPNNKEEKINDDIEEERYLTAEEILTAIITKFKFKAPTLLSSPFQYYIELINGFLPENESIFSIKHWKRRLDFIEEKLDDSEKKIVKLEDAAARKNIVDVKCIIQSFEYGIISEDDLEHIFDDIIIPLISYKNRIESQKDLYEFLITIIDLMNKRLENIKNDKLEKYLGRILDFVSRHRKYIDKKAMVSLYDNILNICKKYEELEELHLAALGMKSEIVEKQDREIIQNEIIQKGILKIENSKIARIVLIAMCKKIIEKKIMEDYYKEQLKNIIEIHKNNNSIVENYYYFMMDFIDNGIDIDISIENLIIEIEKNNLSKTLILHAKRILCEKSEENKKRIEIAKVVIEEFKFEEISKCQECLDYAYFLTVIISGEIIENLNVEKKYIDYSIKLCWKEDGCPYICKRIVNVLYKYISYIDSEYEKQELYKKLIEICENSKLFIDWIYFCQSYIECLDEDEIDKYLSENGRYRKFTEAKDKVEHAVDKYIKKDKNTCKELLLEVSEEYDNLFEGMYNPALINICFMLRRDEIPELDVSYIELLNRIDWMSGNAFYHINRALAYIKVNDWEKVNIEIDKIDSDVKGAIEWWSQEEVVGELEKTMVYFLLLVNNKFEDWHEKKSIKDFLSECINKISMPDYYILEVKNKIASMLE